MNQNLDAELRALIERIGTGETIDPEQIPAALLARPELQRLLKIARVTRALDSHTGNAQPVANSPAQIGTWRLLRLLGSGGMGEVWLGERSDGAVDQYVAVKRLHSDSARFRERLLAERRILARLEHPNIAHFIDAGVDAGGSPWLAMEYVEGSPITDWCSSKALSVRARLQLFQKVCAAVAHAHRHLIVHRDLKPGNVLVNAEGEPKLLDFGIAKLLDGDTGEQTVGALTPAYAAPEQLRGQPISTATDVYALGLLLFRLLAGSLPQTRSSGNAGTMLAQLDSEETQRPSDSAQHTSEKLPYAARELQGDLDAIVAQALRAQPEARYGSVAEFSADIARFLDAQPVRARKPSRWYRFTRFAKRNRGALTVGSAAALAVLISFGLTLWQAYRAERAAAEAAAEASRADAEAALAKTQAARAKGATGFVLSVFLQSDPMRRDARGAISLDEAFEDALKRIDGEFADQPMLAADLNDDFGEILASKGRFDEADARLNKALALAEQAHGPDSLVLAETLLNLTIVQAYRGRPLDGKPFVLRAIEILEKHPGEDPLNLANAHASLGEIYAQEHRPEDALNEAKASLELYRRHLPPGDIRLPIALFNIGATFHTKRDWRQAQRYLDEALSLAEKIQGMEAPGLLPMLSIVLVNRDALGQSTDARKDAERMLRIAEDAFPGAHPHRADARVELGYLRLRDGDGDPAAARRLIEDGIAMYAELQSPAEIKAWHKLVHAISVRKDWSAVLQTQDAMLPRCVALNLVDNSECLGPRAHRALALVLLGRTDEGAALAEEVLRIADEKKIGGTGLIVARQALAESLLKRGEREAAIKAFEAVIELWTKRYVPEHVDALAARARLDEVLSLHGN